MKLKTILLSLVPAVSLTAGSVQLSNEYWDVKIDPDNGCKVTNMVYKPAGKELVNTWKPQKRRQGSTMFGGVWGGHMGGDNQKWMELLRDYMIDKHINHTFWCLNTNSGDTGGLLSYDFTTWDDEKYGLFELSLWQTAESGKYIGLDHEVALGANGISLNDFYANYAASEGSNLDGGKTSSGGEGNTVTPKPPTATTKPAATTTTKPATTTTKPATTTTKPVTTTTKPATTTTKPAPVVTTTAPAPSKDVVYGDANCDGKVTIADATAILQSIGNADEFALTEQGTANADVDGKEGITAADALAIQQYDAKLIEKLPL